MLAERPLRVSIRRPKQDPAFQFQSVFTRKVNELARQSADILLQEVKHQLESKRINATGELSDSVTARVEDSRTGKLISVGSDLIQARTVESGASAHGQGFVRGIGEGNSPFINRIMVWMDAKGISGGKPSAFRIARAIATKGIPSNPSRFPLRHPFTNAQRNTRRKINRMWAVELDKAIARLNSSK